MAERDPFELVEMSPGAQPPSGFGDRILVGLALIALVGGALIAVANLLPDAADAALESVAPSAAPTRTSTPAPTPASNVNWSSSAVLAPDLKPNPAWAGAWVEVTGHLDDPAAATCHLDPTPDVFSYWSGQQLIIDQCRQTFVVTAVTVVLGQ